MCREWPLFFFSSHLCTLTHWSILSSCTALQAVPPAVTPHSISLTDRTFSRTKTPGRKSTAARGNQISYQICLFFQFSLVGISMEVVSQPLHHRMERDTFSPPPPAAKKRKSGRKKKIRFVCAVSVTGVAKTRSVDSLFFLWA